MSKRKIAVTLDEKLVGFLDKVAKGNRSEYLNSLLRERRSQVLKDELIAALSEETSDPEYHQQVKDWDGVAGDGIDGEG